MTAFRLVDGYSKVEDYTRDLTHVRYAKSYWVHKAHELDVWIDRLVKVILDCESRPSRWPRPPFRDSPLYAVLQTMKALFQDGQNMEQIVKSLCGHDPYTMHRVVGEEIKLELARVK